MSITLNKMNNAHGLYEKVIQLNKEIEDISRLAKEVANNDCTVNFNIHINNQSKVEEEICLEKEKEQEDWFSPQVVMEMRANFSKKKDNTEKKMYPLTDYECLNVFAIILKAKYDKRERLISEMNKLGIEIVC